MKTNNTNETFISDYYICNHIATSDCIWLMLRIVVEVIVIQLDHDIF